ncbi:MAG: 4-(cytidine 5'-diphospho)-2-C-methyl-D-erythritol kinase [Lachnospiraceae bacterium]|nr:4-(cytidine 5'-diphospho)-2-C-methyl-D-erythritol kinase [Lachnospiraceae bacterium]
MNVSEKAHAKINISLDVTGVRPDGYHEVKMIMQDLCLCDKVSLRKISESETETATGSERVILTMEGASPDVPADRKNIAVKAAYLMLETFGISEGVSIHLSKQIPSAAGLAGGSADAAAVIRGMNRLFNTGLSLREMMDMGVRLGADVPYCIMGGTALSEGIGERLTKLDTPEFLKGLPVLLVKPNEGVSTREVYTTLDEVCGWKEGMEEVRIKGLHPDVEAAVSSMKNEDFYGLCSLMGNILERVTVRKLPEIEEIKEKLISAGARAAMMSGSGPTVFAFFSTEEERNAAYKLIEMECHEKYTLIGTSVRNQGE